MKYEGRVQIVIGGPASGKSFLGEKAEKLGWDVIDENQYWHRQSDQLSTQNILILLSTSEVRLHYLEVPKPVLESRIKERQRKGDESQYSDMDGAMGAADLVKEGKVVREGLFSELESSIKAKSVSKEVRLQ